MTDLDTLVDRALAGPHQDIGTVDGVLQLENIPPSEGLVMNGREYADLRVFGRKNLEIVTDHEAVRAGLMGYLTRDRAPIIVRREVPVGEVFLVGPGPVRRLRVARTT